MNKRQDIVEAAVSLLEMQGFEKFSASALAEAAGVSKANLFHHFGSLDEIVLEAFEHFALQMEMFSPPAGLGLREWLLALGDASFGLDELPRGLVRGYFAFVARALFDARLRAKVLDTAEAGHAAMTGIVSELYPGDLDEEEIAALARLIFVTADGFALHAQAFPEKRVELAQAWALFVDGIVPAVSLS